MANLSKETIKRIRTVVQAILDQPEFYDQDDWVSGLGQDKSGGCNTTCCFAGWCDYVFNGADDHNNRARIYQTQWRGGSINWDAIAATALGIDKFHVSKLTSPHDCWPIKFYTAYRNARSNRGRAQAFADFSEFFIKRNGNIWG